jgi:hypothetical protein
VTTIAQARSSDRRTHRQSPVNVTRHAKPCFTQVWNWGRLPAVAGVVAADVDTPWADEVLARDDRGRVVWAATGFLAERHGRATLERPGVRAVSLAAAGQPPAQVGMALQVASYLARVRAAGLTPTRAYLTSPSRPTAAPDDLVRIPHLVKVRTTDETTTDEVVWELMRRAEARQWLGVQLPDQEFVEAHLPNLLSLRGAARTGVLPATRAGQRLASLLHGRPTPLSIHLVYRHLDLFRILLAGRGDQT